ncbi:hypothetical protein Leryth_024783 [Lithospermum erythrorhizon]|nr:hypothetical protein Leryth_024783 [Lithospermum erythrorhizon]
MSIYSIGKTLTYSGSRYPEESQQNIPLRFLLTIHKTANTIKITNNALNDAAIELEHGNKILTESASLKDSQ